MYESYGGGGSISLLLTDAKARLLSSDEAKATRALSGVMAFFLILGVTMPSSREMFALVVQNTFTIRNYAWNPFTAGFYEVNFLTGVANILTMLLVGPALEHIWGPREFVKFLAIVNALVGVTMFAVMIGGFAATESEWFLTTIVCGSSGLSAALVVAMKQLYGDFVLFGYASSEPDLENPPDRGTPSKPASPSGAARTVVLQVKHVPSLLFVSAVVFWILGGSGKESLNILLGTYYAWVWLRFFQYHPETRMSGDMHQEFALETFFPSFTRPVVGAVSVLCYKLSLSVGLVDAEKKSAGDNSRTYSYGYGFGYANTSGDSAPSNSNDKYAIPFNPIMDPIAERRRLLAIKAIDDKLAELSRVQPRPASVPTVDRQLAEPVAKEPEKSAQSPSSASPKPQEAASPKSGESSK